MTIEKGKTLILKSSKGTDKQLDWIIHVTKIQFAFQSPSATASWW